MKGKYIITWPDGSTYDKTTNGFDCMFQLGVCKLRFRNILTLKQSRCIWATLMNKKNSAGHYMFWDMTIKKVEVSNWELLKREVKAFCRWWKFKTLTFLFSRL